MSFYLAMVTAEQNVTCVSYSIHFLPMLCSVWCGYQRSLVQKPKIYSHKTLNSDHILFLGNLMSYGTGHMVTKWQQQHLVYPHYYIQTSVPMTV